MSNAVIPLNVIHAAQAAEKSYGCPTSVCCAQWALESAWGAHMSGKNNPFGIKARADQAGTSVLTHEVIAGKSVAMRQVFADYASLDDAFEAHGRLLATGSAYAAARAVRDDPDAYARALTGHYATDPQYGAKLISIMKAHELYAYNAEGVVVASVPPPPVRAPAAVAVTGSHITGQPAPKLGFWASVWASFKKAA